MKYRVVAMLLLCLILGALSLDSGQPSPAPEPKSSDDNTFKSIKIE